MTSQKKGQGRGRGGEEDETMDMKYSERVSGQPKTKHKPSTDRSMSHCLPYIDDIPKKTKKNNNEHEIEREQERK